METTNLSALALIPDGEQWPAIQSFRMASDREVKIWPPHINIFYPFLREQEFEHAVAMLSRELASLGPLHIRFCTFGNFGGTVFLKPHCEEDPALAKLHAACKAAFPGIPEKHDTFSPHLTIGQFRGVKNALDFIQTQAAISIETHISCVSLLARDSIKIPFRIPFRVMLGEGGRVERGDATPYSCGIPCRWTWYQCLPSCTGEAVAGTRRLTRTFSGSVSETAVAAVRLMRSVSAGLGRGGPAPRPLELSDTDLNSRFAQSRNGFCEFFTEFRFTDPCVCQAVADMQQELREIDSNIFMDQGCAPDNIHFTMNVLRLASVQDVHRVVELLDGVVASLVPLTANSAIELQGVGIFDNRILYVKPSENCAIASLRDIFNHTQSALDTSGFKPRDRGSFVAHATVCKSQKGRQFSDSFLRAMRENGYETKNFGSQTLVEVHFCIERQNDELTPPVVYRLQVESSKETESIPDKIELEASVCVAEEAEPKFKPKRWAKRW